MVEGVKKYLFDIKTSIDSINAFLGDKRDFRIYQKNKMLRRAVEREFEIIGEALKKADQIDPALRIENKGRIISLRNRVIHGYDKVDDEIIWGVIIKHLPKLESEVKLLLAK
ncbi:HepT-like ribonuclease domain-containing protein [Ekhidna sp.]|uniref:HepT-like ribonuclease domain-containing protein n=1 Tax=Ekhidna sp. TaxID=2608089 RepID=UPI003CCB80C1